ncbi:MAG: peptide-methionine (S)-S-oxide reductase [Halobacteriovorax sp.]|nr:peptide-methionine (S)-S-oxide reductase [Halobacteriovorax sp.]
MSFISLGAGCFWGVQNILSKLPGVISTEVGYMGGHIDRPTYEQICRGDTGHAEIVRVEYDPEQAKLETLLDFFWRLHDPTTLNQQGYDIGHQYRSVIFCHDEAQIEVAKKSKASFDESKVFGKNAVTEILMASTFWKGEDYHQNYYDKKYGGRAGPVCHVLRDR